MHDTSNYMACVSPCLYMVTLYLMGFLSGYLTVGQAVLLPGISCLHNNNTLATSPGHSPATLNIGETRRFDKVQKRGYVDTVTFIF